MRLITIEVAVAVPDDIDTETLRENIGSAVSETVITSNSSLVDVNVTSIRSYNPSEY